ncbi:hypothetical protein N431DRAFT_437352 [Stipitochalara longipes BDJ]|nr:hypothetical protein N431DRAFT_437352 [Stipitochalara longipes BDJ]
MKNNLDQLKKPGAIGPDVNHLVIPNTIRDAMRLVSLLNEKYLWVDAFCIIQDEDDTKELHLSSMASIYASSFFTIVAAGGDNANHGLRGIFERTKNRNVLCDTIRFQSGQELLAYRSRAWYPEHTTWDSRAWTFQEALFSRRLLIFNGLVSWVCRTAIWEEHVKKPTEDSSFSSNYVTPPLEMNFAAHAPTWPNFEYWNNLVRLFACRQLKYDEDVISAFAGTTFIFNRVFSGGILWGMPEMFFDYCMLWTPLNVVRRRLGSNTSSKNNLPSWSWVGWQGDIVPALIAPLSHPPEHDNQVIAIQPVVQWYQARNPISDIVPINSTYPSLFRTYSENRTAKVPPGWTRKLYPDSTPYYTHDKIPSERFRSPVPLISENSDQSLNNQNPYLFFKAQRAWFYIGEKLNGSRLPWGSCSATLVDSEGNLVGIIRLNIDRLGEPPTGDICEVVALSLGAAVSGGNYYGMLDEWDIIDLPFESGIYKFYFVMWIERKNGTAYRKAIGRVFKGMWESQVLEDIDIVLG